MSLEDEQQPGVFCGLYGLKRKKQHSDRIYKRYIFLRQKFDLEKGEAYAIAEALEKWCDGA